MQSTPFDDRDGVIWFDGKLVPWREARIHVLTHSLHYGGAAFEGERIYNGRAFKLAEHSTRLVHSCRLIKLESPFGPEEIERATREVIAQNKIDNGYVRPIAWRGAEVIGVSARGTRPHVAVTAFPWPAYYSEEARMKGIRVMTASWARPAPNTAPTAAKVAGLYIIATLSRDEAEAAGCEDALMLDYRGQLAEATGANLFLVIDGELHTPTPDCFLDGITRRTVMDLARKRGIKVVERAMWPDELKRATEVFLTGTAVEVNPIRQIDQTSYTVGPITLQLMKDYSQLVRAV